MRTVTPRRNLHGGTKRARETARLSNACADHLLDPHIMQATQGPEQRILMNSRIPFHSPQLEAQQNHERRCPLMDCCADFEGTTREHGSQARLPSIPYRTQASAVLMAQSHPCPPGLSDLLNNPSMLPVLFRSFAVWGQWREAWQQFCEPIASRG